MSPFKQFIRFTLFILVQALVLSHVAPLSRFISPYLYFLFLLWLPFSIKRSTLLVLGFVTGFALDLFLQTPGLHAAPCVLIAYLRPQIISILVPKDTKELAQRSPSVRTMGIAPYALYATVLTFFHHAFLVFLEWMQFGSFGFFIGKVFFTTLVSLLLIAITEMIFRGREKRVR